MEGRMEIEDNSASESESGTLSSSQPHGAGMRKAFLTDEELEDFSAIVDMSDEDMLDSFRRSILSSPIKRFF
jgi:hypothetical protein